MEAENEAETGTEAEVGPCLRGAATIIEGSGQTYDLTLEAKLLWIKRLFFSSGFRR